VAVATPSLTPDQPEGAADHLAELISAQNQIEQQAQQIQILETKLQESEQGKKELEKRLQEMTKQHQILQKAQEQAQTLLKEKDQALQTLQAQHQQLQAPRQPLQVKPAAQTPKPAVIPRPVAANSQTQRGEDMPAFMLD
jgi:chromosome segregation ATPase